MEKGNVTVIAITIVLYTQFNMVTPPHEELIKVSIFFFVEGKERSFRYRMVFMMQHMMFLRGENTCDMDLADLFSSPIQRRSFSECPVLAVRMDHAKQPSLVLFNMPAPSSIVIIDGVPLERLPCTSFTAGM
jgi:hypothetical protein